MSSNGTSTIHGLYKLEIVVIVDSRMYSLLFNSSVQAFITRRVRLALMRREKPVGKFFSVFAAFYAIEISLIQTKSDKSRQKCNKFYHDSDFEFGFWATGEAAPFAGESAVTWWWLCEFGFNPV